MSVLDKTVSDSAVIWNTDREQVLSTVLAMCLITFYSIFVVVLAGWRDYPGYGTETDFLGSMLADAQRLLAGAPLRSDFHPPGFVIVLAGTYSLIGDWVTAGKAIAVVSGIVTLVASYKLFSGLCGRWVALGAASGLVGSSVFVAYSIQATSDVYFAAIFSLAALSALTPPYSLQLGLGLGDASVGGLGWCDARDASPGPWSGAGSWAEAGTWTP